MYPTKTAQVNRKVDGCIPPKLLRSSRKVDKAAGASTRPLLISTRAVSVTETTQFIHHIPQKVLQVKPRSGGVQAPDVRPGLQMLGTGGALALGAWDSVYFSFDDYD